MVDDLILDVFVFFVDFFFLCCVEQNLVILRKDVGTRISQFQSANLVILKEFTPRSGKR